MVVDSAARPASGLSLTCETSKAVYGTTDESGIAKIRIAGRSSLVCGIASECLDTTLRDSDGKIVGNIDATQLLRGQEIAAGEYKLKVIRNVD